ncbi:MAG: S8 family serine peptidase, partial [Thermoanaerobaculales bacterium]|nr:S8 family serine peptidase [Thermoanaerobaculales bacterium]
VDDRGRPLYEPGVVAVKLRAEAAAAAKVLPRRFGLPELDAAMRRLGVTRVEPMFRPRVAKARPDLPDLSRVYRVELPAGADVARAARLLARDEAVAYAEPVVLHYADLTPNDPSYSQQSFWQQIESEAAWDVHKGQDGAEVVIGISDSGVAWRHEDLVDNIHRNLGEDADRDGVVVVQEGGAWVFDPGDLNGVDDDGNGYVDDFVGWNFLNDQGGQDNDPDDPESHGTHVAGLAAARTDNGIGVASISWNVKLLPTSASNSSSDGSIERGLASVVYLAENGADVINMSWGSSVTSQLQREVMAYAQGLGSLLVTSAGNERTSSLQYPSALPGVLSVAAVNSTDRLTSYSNFGLSVDVAAPGGDGLRGLRSTIPSGYGSKQGTSMASPIVAGVFALVKSLHPQWSNQRLIEQVLGTAAEIDGLNAGFEGQLGHGRVDAFSAVDGSPSSDPPELRLQVMAVTVADDTGDGSLEPGEGAALRVTLRNFNQLGGSQSLALRLVSDSPFVDVLEAEVLTPIGADEELELAAPFTIEVAAGAPSGLYELRLSAEAGDAGVSAASELELPPLVVANGGVLVWEGAEGRTFSGRYLADELAARGYDVLSLVGDFPSGLVGFDAVFLSFGNAGLDDPDLGLDYLSARLDADWKVAAIESYLRAGGRLYLEGSDTLGYDVYDLVDGESLLPLFGIASGVDGGTNPIDGLDGQNGTLAEGMRFTDTDQDPVEWIDIFTPGTGAAAFVESGYGVVAVQHAGSFGQRTFGFAYSIADLVDGATTRGQLLDAILDFLQPGEEPPAVSPRRAGRRLTPSP